MPETEAAKLPNFIASTHNGRHFCKCGRIVSQCYDGTWAHNNTADDCRRAVNWNTYN